MSLMLYITLLLCILGRKLHFEYMHHLDKSGCTWLHHLVFLNREARIWCGWQWARFGRATQLPLPWSGLLIRRC